MVVNGDDSFGQRLLRESIPGVNAVSYGMGLGMDFRASDFQTTFEGTSFTLEAKGRTYRVRFAIDRSLQPVQRTGVGGCGPGDGVKCQGSGGAFERSAARCQDGWNP